MSTNVTEKIPDMRNLQSRGCRLWRRSKTKTKMKTYTFKRCAEFFLADVKAAMRRSSGRIMLGDDIGREAVVLRPIRFHCIGLWISTGLTGIMYG